MKRLFLAIIAAVTVFAVSAQKKGEGVYVMGVSISFSDSIVYFTEVQLIEGVSLQKGTGFLPDRQYYSLELQNYMASSEQMPGRTSVILFAKSKSKLQKREAKLKAKLQKRRSKVVRYLGDKFKFTRP